MKQWQRKKIIQSAIGILVCVSMLAESSPLRAMSYEGQLYRSTTPSTPLASTAPAPSARVAAKPAPFNKPGQQTAPLTEAPLLPDWNLVSIPTAQANTDPTAVLAGIAGDYNTVFAYDGCNTADPWQIYDPAAPPVTNDLTAVDHTIGFWVQATTETALPITGSVPPSTTIELCPGWNLIGMPTEQARPVRNALFSIEGKYTLVFGYDPTDSDDPWAVYDVDAPDWANDLQMMQPGRGYWVLATEATTLTFANTGEPPIVEIASPEETTTELTSITFITDVIGTAYSDFLANWTLAFRSQGESKWTPFASNTAPVIDDVLGQFDPTLLLNGLYELQLTATDYTGQAATTQVSVIVEGNLKLGHFTLPLLDLEVPVAGLPIQVVRTYDSRDKQKGDFGVGWTLSTNNVQLRESVAPGDRWLASTSGAAFHTYCISPSQAHIVTITLPDDSVYAFTPTVVPECQALVPPQVVNFAYVPLVGTNATLEPLDHSTDQLLVVGGFPSSPFADPRPVALWDQDNVTIHDPTTYLLTLPDGREFIIDQDDGLRQVTDLNGNILTMNENGIMHSSGVGVTFVRDDHGRIVQIIDPLNNTIAYHYDQNGDLVEMVDQEDFVTTYTYLDNHYLNTIIDPDGREVAAMNYDGDGRLSQYCDFDQGCSQVEQNFIANTQTTTDATGRTETVAYDVLGNVISRTNGLGHTYLYEYDDLGNVTQETDPTGAITTYNYDARGNLLSLTEPHSESEAAADFTTTYTYNSRDQVTSYTLPTGAYINVGYDSNGNLEQLQDEEGNTLIGFSYGPGGVVTSESSAFGTVTYADHDAQGNPGTIIGPDGDASTFTYDDIGNVTSMVQDGITSTFTYDGRNRELTSDYGQGMTLQYNYGFSDDWTELSSSHMGNFSREYNANGRPVSFEGADGASVSVRYDAAGRVIEENNLLGHPVGYGYDAAGQLQTITSPGGAITTFSYDPAGRVNQETDALGNTTVFTYTADGRIAAMTTSLGQTWEFSHTLTTTVITDPLGRQTTQIFTPHGLPHKTVNPDGTTSEVTYLLSSPLVEAEHFPLTVTDEGGHTRFYEYNDFGQLEMASNLAGITYTYTYEGGNLVAITGPTGETRQYSYDEFNNPQTIIYADGGEEIFDYGLKLLPQTITRPSGIVITNTFDVLDRPLTRRSSLGEMSEFAWNANNDLTQTVDETGITDYSYNLDGFLAQIDYASGAVVHYGRDLTGRVVTMTVKPSLNSPTYTTYYDYDAFGNLTSVIDPLNGTTTIEYDAVNRPVTRTLPNGIVTAFSYNARDQITSIIHRDAAGTVLASVTYERQGVGEPTRIIREDNSYVDLTYDEALRLITEKYYDPSGVLIEAAGYEYDDAGNRLVYSNTLGVSTYTYQPGYQLTAMTTPSGTESYAYDADGRVSEITRDGTSYLLNYSSDDHLTAVTDIISGTVVTYTYDAVGRRVQAVDPANTRQFLVAPGMGDGLESLQYITNENGDLVSGYVYAGEFPLMRFDANGPVYYLFDAMGSTIALADNTGSNVASFHYDSFGLIRSTTGTPGFPESAGGDFRFQGAWLEAATGLYHMRARDYDPRVGRFISRDKIEPDLLQPESLHPYAFANNNPHVYRDPTGLFGLVSFNISFGIQGNLNSIRTLALNYIRHWVKDKIGEAVVNILLKALESLIPFKLDFSGGIFSAGQQFDKAVGGAICDLLGEGVASSFWFEPTIIPATGRAVQNGRQCDGGARVPVVGGSLPDIVIRRTPPKNTRDKTWITAEIKLSVSTFHNAYIDPAYNRRQWNAIANHAKRYGYPPHVVVFIAFFRGKRAEMREVQRLAIQKQLILVIITIK